MYFERSRLIIQKVDLTKMHSEHFLDNVSQFSFFYLLLPLVTIRKKEEGESSFTQNKGSLLLLDLSLIHI